MNLKLDGTNRTTTRANFENAIAISVNFSKAVFSNDPSGLRTEFGGAILYGADFTNATVHGVKFQGAYFDDSVISQTAITYLSTKYTTFPGSKFPSTYVCPQFGISNKSSVPKKTDSSVICFNGNLGFCNINDWSISGKPDVLLIILSKTTPYTMPLGCQAKSYLFW